MEDILYCCIHEQLSKNIGNNIISRKQFCNYLGTYVRIGKKYRPVVIKYLESKEVIKILNKGYIQVLPFNKDLDLLYKTSGLF